MRRLQPAARLQAAGIDLDPSAISRIENQDRVVSDLEILAICKALKVPVEWFFKAPTAPSEPVSNGRGSNIRLSPGRGLLFVSGRRREGIVLSPRFFLTTLSAASDCVRISPQGVFHARIPSSIEGRDQQPAARS